MMAETFVFEEKKRLNEFRLYRVCIVDILARNVYYKGTLLFVAFYVCVFPE